MCIRDSSIPFTKTPKDAAAGGLMKGQNLANLFSDLTMEYHDSIDFNKLPIPFACVAANVVNGEQIVFHDGILSTAMRDVYKRQVINGIPYVFGNNALIAS